MDEPTRRLLEEQRQRAQLSMSLDASRLLGISGIAKQAEELNERHSAPMMKRKTFRLIAFLVLAALVIVPISIWARAHWDLVLGLKIETYSDIGQFATAIIAVIAALLVGWQVHVQRELARQRTAFDFFFKTEMEEELWQSYQKSRVHFKRLRGGEIFSSGTDEYFMVRKYLNIHELMSVGIDQDVLDDHVCYYYWADELIRDYESAKQFILNLRTLPEEATQYTYADLEKTYTRWKRRRDAATSFWWWLRLR